ncbi:unnamed protein product [Musa textilis]
MEGDGAAAEKAPAADAFATSQEEPTPSSSSSTKSPFDPCTSAAATSPGEILRALQVVERDSVAIAESYASLFSSLRIALSEVTSTSIENMQCFNDVVGRLQESALDAATKGNRYINSCLRCCLVSDLTCSFWLIKLLRPLLNSVYFPFFNPIVSIKKSILFVYCVGY